MGLQVNVERWQPHLERAHSRGISLAQYAREQGLSRHTLYAARQQQSAVRAIAVTGPHKSAMPSKRGVVANAGPSPTPRADRAAFVAVKLVPTEASPSSPSQPCSAQAFVHDLLASTKPVDAIIPKVATATSASPASPAPLVTTLQAWLPNGVQISLDISALPALPNLAHPSMQFAQAANGSQAGSPAGSPAGWQVSHVEQTAWAQVLHVLAGLPCSR